MAQEHAVYIVMELVDGSSLSEILKRTGPMQPQWAARIALEILDAIQAAHGAGIIHRDIKPSNIMLPSADPPAKLADFGIAWVHEDTKLTQTDTIIGSPAYLSPEQINGDPVTPATDLWQLGVTLHRMLHGSSPFSRGDQQSTLFAILGHTPAPLDCGGPLASTIAALLNKQPERRPTAAELRPVLEQYVETTRTSESATTTTRARTPGRALVSPRWRRPALVAAATLALTCAVVGGVVVGRTIASPRGWNAAAQPSRSLQVLTWDTVNNVSGRDSASVDMTDIAFENTGCANGTLEANHTIHEADCAAGHAIEVFASFRLPTTPGNLYPQNMPETAADMGQEARGLASVADGDEKLRG